MFNQVHSDLSGQKVYSRLAPANDHRGRDSPLNEHPISFSTFLNLK